jgi:hypothetical protein
MMVAPAPIPVTVPGIAMPQSIPDGEPIAKGGRAWILIRDVPLKWSGYVPHPTKTLPER